MTVYTWLVVLLIAAAFLLNGNQKHSKKFILVAFILLFAVMGLRDVYSTGNDASGTFGSYPNIFNNAGKNAWSSLSGRGENNFNIGFAYLTKALYIITNGNYQLYVSLISLFVMIAYMRFIDRYSPAPIQSVLCLMGLLYYSMLFDVLKQALAMSVLLYAFDAIIEKRPIRFIIFTAIAALLHFPALVFLPAYWIGRMKIGRKYIALLAALLVLTFIFRDQLLNIMLNAYSGGEGTASMAGVRFLRNKVILMIAITALAVIIKPPSSEDSVYNALLMFAGVAIIFQTFCGYNNIFERLADYYFHTSIILIPMIFDKDVTEGLLADTQNNRQVLSYASFLICTFAVWRFLSYMNNAWIFNSYQFFWQR